MKNSDLFGLSPTRNAVRLTDQQRLDWLRLIRSENVGPVAFRTLVNHFGGAGAALAAIPEMSRRGGAQRPIRIASREEAELEMAAAWRMDVRFVALGEADYPPLLRLVASSPPLLAVRGRGEALAAPIVAIVGARNASALGRKFAGMLARDLGAAGFVIASGLARGIDAAAHEASLGSGTVASLAGGHGRIYPPENAPLLEALVARGAAVSEMPLDWEPRARDFPRRNRLIAGMSYGVIVVEAAERSGSLITARMAGEIGRDVLAVPGSPLDPRASGTNRLIRDGATLITCAEDVIEALRPQIDREDLFPPPPQVEERDPAAPPAEANEDDRSRVVSALGAAPVEIDDLIRQARVPAQTVRLVLLELELAGRIEYHGGNRVSLR